MTEAEEIELQATTELVARLRKHAKEIDELIDEDECFLEEWAVDLRVAANHIEAKSRITGLPLGGMNDRRILVRSIRSCTPDPVAVGFLHARVRNGMGLAVGSARLELPDCSRQGSRALPRNLENSPATGPRGE